MVLSIVVPVYNVFPYLDECIISLLRQNIDDYEVILVDDGSTDGSEALCDRYEERCPCIRVVHKENGGLGSARNAGLRLAQGEYILFVDSDDYLKQNSISDLVRIAKKDRLDILLFAGQSFSEDDNSYQMTDYSKTKNLFQIMSGSECIEASLSSSEYASSTCLRLLRREYILSKGFIFNEEYIHEDEDFSFLSLLHAERVEIVPKVVYMRRYRSGSIMTGGHFVQSYEGCSFAINRIVSHAQNEITNDRMRELCYAYSGRLLSVILSKLASMSRPERIQYEDDVRALIKLGQEHMREYPMKVRLASKSIAAYCVCQRGASIAKRFSLAFRSRVGCFFKDPLCYPLTLLLAVPFRPNAVVLLGTPVHGNIGDHLIASSEMSFFKKHVDALPVEFTMPFATKHLEALKCTCKPNDIIVISGGGWLGTEWRHNEDFVRRVIETFPDNRIVILPQTVFYDGEARYLKMGAEIYSGHDDLRFFLRDSASYNLVLASFLVGNPKNAVFVPDMALFYDDVENAYSSCKREGVGICLRDDIEAVLDSEERRDILDAALSLDPNPRIIITNSANTSISRRRRKRAISDKLNEIASVKLLITDRLHAMLMAALTNTPCIAFDNSTGKVSGVYEWIKELDYVRLVNSADEMNECLNYLMKNRPKTTFKDWDAERFLRTIRSAFE